MKRHAVIDKKTGEVVNVIVLGKSDAYSAHRGMKLIQSDAAGIGDIFSDGDFIKPVLEAHIPDYKKLREAEYPPIGDQLDAIMKWAATENEITLSPEFKSIAMTCMSVKAKYPKGTK